MGNPNPSIATRFKPGVSGNPSGKRSLAWMKNRLDQIGKDGNDERARILEHLIEVATRWEVRVIGKDSEGELLRVASARDSVEAAKLIYAYAEGKPPESEDVRSLALAEHMRKVAHDAAELALKVLGSRVYSMTPKELAAFFRECTGDSESYLKIAKDEIEAREESALAIEAPAEPAEKTPDPETAHDQEWPQP